MLHDKVVCADVLRLSSMETTKLSLDVCNASPAFRGVPRTWAAGCGRHPILRATPEGLKILLQHRLRQRAARLRRALHLREEALRRAARVAAPGCPAEALQRREEVEEPPRRRALL